MFVKILVLLFLPVSLSVTLKDICGQANSAFRIAGGTNATSCEYPWMALISSQINQTSLNCGGSIIDSTHILTAAHCLVILDNTTKSQVVTRATDVFVYTGSSTRGTLPGSGSTRRSIAKVIIHEQYNYSRSVNDIAILTLTEPISFNKCERPLCLVSATSSPQEAINCRVMGWGRTSDMNNARYPTILQWVDVPVVNDTECKSEYGSYYTANNICVGKNPCQGDSGGPLACRGSDGRYYAHGVASYARYGKCGLVFTAYIKVSSFIPWIQGIVSITG